MPAIEVKDLIKIYRVYRKYPGWKGTLRYLLRREFEDIRAVDGISFEVSEGELIGFLGPNGAGKTTTLKILAGLLYPTSGLVKVLGFVPWERHPEYRRRFALVLGQKNQLWWDLPAMETYELNAKIYGIPSPEWRNRVEELGTILGVTSKFHVPVRELSLGERMKLELIAALLHKPKILFLDEPTLGLDVVSQKIVRDFIARYNKEEKTTIILTSHYLADIEELCQRVIIIDHGKIVFDGPLATVIDRFSDAKVITVYLRSAYQQPIPPLLNKLGEIIKVEPAKITLKVKKDRVIDTCKQILDELPVHDIDIEDVPVEDIIRKLFANEHTNYSTT